MGIWEHLQERREEILRAAARYGASNVRVFGSVARGEAGPESDVDVLVDLEPGRSLLDTRPCCWSWKSCSAARSMW